jgi:hypothetical protein
VDSDIERIGQGGFVMFICPRCKKETKVLYHNYTTSMPYILIDESKEIHPVADKLYDCCYTCCGNNTMYIKAEEDL